MSEVKLKFLVHDEREGRGETEPQAVITWRFETTAFVVERDQRRRFFFCQIPMMSYSFGSRCMI